MLRYGVGVVLLLACFDDSSHGQPARITTLRDVSFLATDISASGRRIVGRTWWYAPCLWDRHAGFALLEPFRCSIVECYQSAVAVSDDGGTVALWLQGGIAGTGPSWIWRDEQFITLDCDPKVFSACSVLALGMSADGLMVVGAAGDIPKAYTPFRWTEADGMRALGELPEGSRSGWATAVSDDKQAIIGYIEGPTGETRAFRWTISTEIELLPQPSDARSCSADVVSADGNVIFGTCLTQPGGRTVRWSAAGDLSEIPPLAEEGSYSPIAASEDGRIVYGYDFIWHAETGTMPLIELMRDVYGFDVPFAGVHATAATPDALIFANGHQIVRLGDCNRNRVPDHVEFVPDRDCDEDVDLVDFGRFQTCFTGSGGDRAPHCIFVDGDADGDVDLADARAFAESVTGPR